MEIILLESLHKIGKAGEIVSVKDGYANNYLIPRKMAIVANKHNKKSLDTRIVDINTKNKEIKDVGICYLKKRNSPFQFISNHSIDVRYLEII